MKSIQVLFTLITTLATAWGISALPTDGADSFDLSEPGLAERGSLGSRGKGEHYMRLYLHENQKAYATNIGQRIDPWDRTGASEIDLFPWGTYREVFRVTTYQNADMEKVTDDVECEITVTDKKFLTGRIEFDLKNNPEKPNMVVTKYDKCGRPTNVMCASITLQECKPWVDK